LGKGAIPLILIQGGITLGAIVLALTLTILLIWLLWVAGSFKPGGFTATRRMVVLRWESRSLGFPRNGDPGKDLTILFTGGKRPKLK